MRRNIKGGLAAAGILLLLCLSFPAYGTKKELDAEKEKVSAIEEEKKKVENTLKNLEGQKADTENYVRQLDQEMAVISGQLEELSVQISDKEGEIALTQEELTQARDTEAEQYASMKLRIKYMYEKGDATFIDLILESKTISQLLNRAEYIAQISQYDRQMLDEYAATRQAIADNEAKLQAEHEELLALQESTQAKHNSVEELLAAKEAQLKAYDTQIASAQGQINAYQQDLAAQETKIRQIEEEIKKLRRKPGKRLRRRPGKRANLPEPRILQRAWEILSLSGPVPPAAGSPPALAAGNRLQRALPAIIRESTSEPAQEAILWRRRTAW